MLKIESHYALLILNIGESILPYYMNLSKKLLLEFNVECYIHVCDVTLYQNVNALRFA